jgi:hypothetical protein
MAEQDVSKMTFRCPGFVSLFKWVVMMFGLKNAGAIFEHTINMIFHDLLGKLLEVYIDDESSGFKEHLADLSVTFSRMRKYGLKMTPAKCAFAVSARKLLGFIMHEGRIQVDPKKVESIGKLAELECKRDV